MTALAATPSMEEGLRPVDVRCDLPGVARLVELCFGDALDESGRAAIREMRALSRAGPLLWLLPLFPGGGPAWQHGFVYTHAGRLVGNVGAQPADSGRDAWLLANVAVHPDWRRKGIARQLVLAAVARAAHEGAQRVVLQVDADNIDAITLYKQLGFDTLTVRTTWRRSQTRPPEATPMPAGIELRPAQRSQWPLEQALLQQFRPQGLTWTAPLQVRHLCPSFGRNLGHYFNGRREERWLAFRSGETVGWLYVLWSAGTADQIRWIVTPQLTGALEHALLERALCRLGHRRCDAWVEHPTGEAAALLQQHRFKPTRTLRWMELCLSRRD